MFIYALCEVATVSQLCIFFPYVLHGLCEDYLTCDIAFNAVMPPSRASTRGRYSRIEGVTLSHEVRDEEAAQLLPESHRRFWQVEKPSAWRAPEGHGEPVCHDLVV